MSEAVQNWRALYRLFDAAHSSTGFGLGSWLDRLAADAKPSEPLLRRLLAQRDLLESASFLHSLPQFTAVPGACSRAPAASLGDQIGPYRLQRLLGSGGMGSVWLASRSDHTPGHFALKLPHAARGDEVPAEIVERERSILAALDHPQIVRLHDAGVTEDGHAYLTLQYIDGEHIDQYCLSRRPDIAHRVALLLQIARILSHAHARGIVHRDLKPANLLVDSSGRVHLLDFGIAALLREPAQGEPHGPADIRTRHLGAALTPSYASPEQLRGEDPSTAADIYSLGVVAYELLTGRRPHELNAHRPLTSSPTEPIAPSDAAIDPVARAALLGDLDAIVLKALKKSPIDRYGSVDDLAQDVERYLSDEGVRAMPLAHAVMMMGDARCSATCATCWRWVGR